MSVLPPVSEKTQGMEVGLDLQDRARPLCWPHVNGTAHHNLPPIAALTSCRPSSSPALKTPVPSAIPKERNEPPVLTQLQSTTSTSSSPKPPPIVPKDSLCPSPSPSSPRDRKDEHIFTQPNPPRLIQPAARAPTPFPDHPPSNPHVFHNTGLPPIRLEPRISSEVLPPRISDVSMPNAAPVPFSIPTKSAFATVHRTCPDRSSPSNRPHRITGPESPQDGGANSIESPSPGGGRHTPRSPTVQVGCSAQTHSDNSYTSLTQANGRAPAEGENMPPTNEQLLHTIVDQGSSTYVAPSFSNLTNEKTTSEVLDRIPAEVHFIGKPVERGEISTSLRDKAEIIPYQSATPVARSPSTITSHPVVENYPHNATNHLISKPSNPNEQRKTSEGTHFLHGNENTHPSHFTNTLDTKLQNIPSQPERYVATSTTQNVSPFNNQSNRMLPSTGSMQNFSSQSERYVPQNVPPTSTDGLRNFSNQSHRYFATPTSTENARAYSQPPSQRNIPPLPTSTGPSTFSSQSYSSTASAPENIRGSNGNNSITTSTSLPPTIITPPEFMRNVASPSERKPPQQAPPSSPNENYRRFLPPNERIHPNAMSGGSEVPHNFSPRSDRYSPQVLAGHPEHFRNFSHHSGAVPNSRTMPAQIERNNTTHQNPTSIDMRNYSLQNSDKPNIHSNIPTSRENSSSFQQYKDRSSALSDGGARTPEASRTAPPQGERRPPYPQGPAANERLPSFTPQSNQGNYHHSAGTHSIRNFAPQHDRAGVYPTSTVPSFESLRGYSQHIDKGTVASSASLRTLQPQGARPGYNIHAPTGLSEPNRDIRNTQAAVTSSFPHPGAVSANSRTFASQNDRLYSQSMISDSNQPRPYAHQSEKGMVNYPPLGVSGSSRNCTPPVQRPGSYTPNSAKLSPHMVLHSDKGGKYQSASPIGYSTPTSVGGVSSASAVQKRPEPSNYPGHHVSRETFQAYSRSGTGSHVGMPPSSQSQSISNYPQASRPPQAAQYYRSDPNRQPWSASLNPVRPQESNQTKGPLHRSLDIEKHHPHGLSPSRNSASYSQTHHSPVSSEPSALRDRPINYPPTSALPRINPPAVVSVSSHHSPRFSSHPSQSGVPYYGNPRAPAPHPSTHTVEHAQVGSSYQYGTSPHITSDVSSSGLQRANFPSSVASYSGAAPPLSSTAAYAHARGSGPSTSLSSSQQNYPRHPTVRDIPKQPQAPVTSQARHHSYSSGQTYSYPTSHQGSQPTPVSSCQPGRQQMSNMAAYSGVSGSQYTPTRGQSIESDTCRNPFELPVLNSHSRTSNNPGVIKSHHAIPSVGYGPKPNDSKTTAPGSLPRPPYDSFPGNSVPPRSDSAKQSDSAQLVASRYAMPSPRTEQRSASGSDERQKLPPLSARFPPVPQSNYDLQRQIYDRMTGLQQAPPRLIEKSLTEEKPLPGYKVDAISRQKRESPLDLSVKTVRQSADSTRDDIDLYLAKHFSQEPRLASAPKIDFNPNFAAPLVQPETRNVVSLPPVQSIRKFQPAPLMEPTRRKRPVEEQEPILPPKIPRVDAWKLAMDEQIEERLKAARQARPPAAPLTPLHPPAQSVTPTNPELLQPPARPQNEHVMQQKYERTPQGLEVGKPTARGWSSGVFQPPSGNGDPERLVQQISQGVMADTRLLQDRNVVDILRSTLEEKEARLQALQAAARRRQPLPPFDALGVERMCVPPSYPHGHPRGAEPIPIGVEATRNYLRGPETDLDGLAAAFLAARFRTKAEMKQMGPSAEHLRTSDLQGERPVAASASPPKLIREGRLPHIIAAQQQRRILISPSSEESVPVPPQMAPRDPAGLRSSSETSVFDFRESDSEGEMPVLERQTLDGMRRPRRTQPRPAATVPIEPQPGPAPKDELPPEPDPLWDNACDMFVEQLQKRPIKRSVRKKKPNPKFFANEMETPTFLKVKTEEPEVQEEPDNLEGKDPVLESGSTKPKSSRDLKQETEEPRDCDVEMPPLPPVLKEESSSGEEEMLGVTVVKEGRVKMVMRKQRVVASDSEWGSSAVDSTSMDESASASSGSDSDNDSEDSTAKKVSRRAQARETSGSEEETITRGRKGRRTRSRAVSGSGGESDENVARTKHQRSRVVASDSEGCERSEAKGRSHRNRLISESGDDSDSKQKRTRTRTGAGSESEEESEHRYGVRGRCERVQTRQQAKSVHPPARMRLRSKKRGTGKNSAFRPGWENDLIKFKQQLRMPDRLISVTKPNKRQGPTSLPDLDEDNEENTSLSKTAKKLKKEKKDLNEKSEISLKTSPRSKGAKGKLVKEKDSKESKSKDRPSSAPPLSRRSRLGMVTRGKGKLLPKRGGLRASVGMRRSNKAVQNSKRHLNKGKKRLKLRRKFRSGLDYLRRKKKQSQRKEADETPVLNETKESKRRERTDVTDISAEVKTWVVNKSAGETILHRASRLGYADVAAYCLESLHFAPSPRDYAGYTPLHEACSRGHVAVANYLLQYGASVSESARGGIRPLHQAAENNHMELVRLLLAYGADPLLATYTGQTALTLASQDDVRDLIKRHLADVQGEDAPKWSFEGPATVFDPKWAANPLADPPSPEPLPYEVEIEASKDLLPPLFRLPPTDGESYEPSDRWLLLVDLLAYTQAPSADVLLGSLPNTMRREMTDDDFRERAIPCNILTAPKPPGRKVHLLRYDDDVRQVLQLEVLTVSLADS